MENLMEKMKNININNYDVGSAHWVDVTYIEHPGYFYVRPTVYRDYLSVLSSYGDRFPLSELSVGSIIVFKSKLLKCYARGRVMFIQTEDNPSCDVFAPDYGSYENCISLRRIYKALHPIDIPPLAILCQLADCKPHELPWSTEAIESMKYFVGDERAKMIIKGKSPESLIVELINSCPDDIATMLAYSGHSLFGFGQNEINRFTEVQPEKHYFIYKSLEIGDTLTVRVQAGDSLKHFYVADVHDYKRYLNERENFTYFCKKQKELEPDELKVGMPVGVLVFATNKYERAYVTEITVSNEKAIVKLVDWGKTAEVPLNRLRAMPEKFFMQPVVAIYCSTEDSQPWDNGLQKFLYPGYEFQITVTEIGEKFETPHIVSLAPKC